MDNFFLVRGTKAFKTEELRMHHKIYFVEVYHNLNNYNLDNRFFVSKNYSHTELFYLRIGNKKLRLQVNRHKCVIKCHRKQNSTRDF